MFVNHILASVNHIRAFETYILAFVNYILPSFFTNQTQKPTAKEKAHLQSATPNAKPKIAKELFLFPLLPTLKKRINFLLSNPKNQPCRIDGTAYNKSFARLRGKVLNSSSVLRLNFSNKTAFVLRFPPHRQAEKRCGKIRSAPFATSVRRITSADVARRYANFAHL